MKVSRRTGERIFLVLGAIVFCELVLRLIGYAPHGGAVYDTINPLVERHSLLGWRLAPGVHNYGTLPDGKPIPVTVTDYHSRATAENLLLVPPPDQSRRSVIFLGDSFTFGEGLSDEQTFPWLVRQRLLEERLRRPENAEAVNVYNFAAIGYGTCQSYLMMHLLNEQRRTAGLQGNAVYIYGYSSFHQDRNVATPALLWRTARASASNSAYMPWCIADGGGQVTVHQPEEFILPAALIVDRFALGTFAADAYYFWAGRERRRLRLATTRALLKEMNEEAAKFGNRFAVLLQRIEAAEKEGLIEFLRGEGIAYITGETLSPDVPGALAADGRHPGPAQAIRWSEQVGRYLAAAAPQPPPAAAEIRVP